jgi:hypothetical protein
LPNPPQTAKLARVTAVERAAARTAVWLSQNVRIGVLEKAIAAVTTLPILNRLMLTSAFEQLEHFRVCE